MRLFTSAKRVIEDGRAGASRLYANPNTRYALIGIIGGLIILGITLIGLKFVGKGESVEAFVQRWKGAVESKQTPKYQALWDTKARRQNQDGYERTLGHFTHEKVEIDLTGMLPRKDFKNKNRYQIEDISVTLYQDGEILVRLYHELTIEKKGLSRRWKLIKDQIRGEPEYPQTSEETPVVEVPSTLSGTTNSSPNPTVSTNPIESVMGNTRPQTPKPQNVVKPDVSTPFEGNAPLDTKLKVHQVLGVWQDAWQGKDLEAYLSVYAEDAEITRVSVTAGKEVPTKLSKTELREKMIALNKRYGKIEVSISNVKINGDTAVADVSFLQEFIGTPADGNRPSYSDYGTKTLIFMVDPNDNTWKIYAETWKMYENVPKFRKL